MTNKSLQEIIDKKIKNLEGGNYISEGILKRNREDIKKAVNKDSDNLWELIGQLSGLKLSYNIPNEAMCKINELSSEYLRKKEELFGDFKNE